MLHLLLLTAASYAQDAAVEVGSTPGVVSLGTDAAVVLGASDLAALPAATGAAWFGAELAGALLPDATDRQKKIRRLLVPAAGWLAAVVASVVVCAPTSWPAIVVCAVTAGGPALVAVLGHRITRAKR